MTTVTLNGEIITILSESGALWTCCGPNGNGVEFADLLDSLQTRYPTSQWTSTLLGSTLLTGQKEARYKENPADTYYLNPFMIKLNVQNAKYQVYSDYICDAPDCQRRFGVL